MTTDLLKLRAGFVLLLVAAYAILNHGFMLVRLPPGSGFGIPLGELAIVLFALTFLFELRRLPTFAAIAPMIPLLLWWSGGIVRALLGTQQHGMWALRDASHVLDSLFLWIGFVVAATPGFLEGFSRWFRAVLNVGAIYALTYPFRDLLSAISPKISAPAGYSVPIFFNYFSGALVPLTAATRWLVDRVNLFGIPAVVLAGAIIVYAVAVFQMRTTYLQLLALLLIMLAIQPRVVVRMSAAMLLGAAALALLLASGVEITGRLGEKISLDFFLQHIAAIWGEQGRGALYDAASGVDQRLRWWAMIWKRLNADVGTLLFGLGYGVTLTDFIGGDGEIVREPHNSMMSVLGRGGLIGVAIFVWIHAAMARIWWRAHRLAKRNRNQLWVNNLIIMGVYFLLVWVLSIGEDAFEKPFNAIPFYFLWGVIFRVYYEMRVPSGRLYDAGADVETVAGDESVAGARAVSAQTS